MNTDKTKFYHKCELCRAEFFTHSSWVGHARAHCRRNEMRLVVTNSNEIYPIYSNRYHTKYEIVEEVNVDVKKEAEMMYGGLKVASDLRYNRLQEMFHASEKVIKLKKQLTEKKAEGIMSREISGKNADDREASARVYMPELFVAMGEAEDEERKCQFELDIANCDLEIARFRLRLLEILSKGE